jgi:hypothetical protein
MQEPGVRADQFAAIVVDAAIEVHRHLGPAFLENVYENALCHELRARQVPFERQVAFTRRRGPLISSLARILASLAAWRLPQ